MVDRAKRIVHDVDAWIIRHRWSRVARRAIIGFMQHNALQNAGSMAYFAILSIFQLLVLGVVAASFFLGEGQARDFVIEQAEAATPMEPNTVASIIDGVIASRGGVSLVSAIFLIWGAMGVFRALNRGIAGAFVAAEPRGFVQDNLIGLALIALTGALVLASVLIGLITGILQNATDDVLASIPGGDVALGLFGFIVPILLIFIAFLAIYRLTPNRPVTLGEVWPGALVAALLWSAVRIGFTYYATDVANYDTAFGPISAAISLLVFLYFASIVVLLGAEVARANVLDNEVPAPRPVMAEAVAASAGRATARSADGEAAEAQEPGGEQRRIPGWALAVGGAVAAVVVRWLSARGGRGG